MRTLSLEKRKTLCFRHSCYCRQNVILSSCTVTLKTRLYCSVVHHITQTTTFKSYMVWAKGGIQLLSHTLSPKTIKLVNENKNSKFSEFPQLIWPPTLNLITSGSFFKCHCYMVKTFWVNASFCFITLLNIPATFLWLVP